ncbi:MAG TPA: Snf7 family protein [Nitrososphaerales archaeon]|nr:Snf7 family protein [Nitrososphaerales archaeon]
MSKFEKQWKTQDNTDSFAKRTREAVRGPQPLKPQIQKATQQLAAEINRLDAANNRLKQRENSIFKKTVTAVQAHDQESSKAYSNELAEVRKMQKIVTQSKIALEQITTRLQTVTDVGDFAATIAPAIGVIRSVRTTLGEAMPDAQSTLGEIGAQLNSIMADVGQITGTNFYMAENSDEANKILSEAAAIAEKRINESLPDVPNSSGESIYSSSG